MKFISKVLSNLRYFVSLLTRLTEGMFSFNTVLPYCLFYFVVNSNCNTTCTQPKTKGRLFICLSIMHREQAEGIGSWFFAAKYYHFFRKKLKSI